MYMCVCVCVWNAQINRLFTWLSTNIAMSMNISCSSRIEFSSFMISLCLASMSAKVCLACCVSMMICKNDKHNSSQSFLFHFGRKHWKSNGFFKLLFLNDIINGSTMMQIQMASKLTNQWLVLKHWEIKIYGLNMHSCHLKSYIAILDCSNNYETIIYLFVYSGYNGEVKVCFLWMKSELWKEYRIQMIAVVITSSKVSLLKKEAI